MRFDVTAMPRSGILLPFIGTLAAVLLLAGCAGAPASPRDSRTGDRDSIDRIENELKKAQELVRALRAQLAAAAVEREALLADVAEFKADARMRRQEVDQAAAEKAILEERLRLSDQAERELWKKHQQAAGLLGFLADEAAALRSDWRDFELKMRMRLRPAEDRETIERMSRLADRIDRLRFELLREWSAFGERPGFLAASPAAGQGQGAGQGPAPARPPGRDPPPAIASGPAGGEAGAPAGGEAGPGTSAAIETPAARAGGETVVLLTEPPRPLPIGTGEPVPASASPENPSGSRSAGAGDWLRGETAREMIRVLILVSSGAFSAAVFIFGLRKLQARRIGGAAAGAAAASPPANAVEAAKAPAAESVEEKKAAAPAAPETPDDDSGGDDGAASETGEVTVDAPYRGTELVQEPPREPPALFKAPLPPQAPAADAGIRKISPRRPPIEEKPPPEDESFAAEPPSSTQVISQPSLEDGSHTQLISEEFLPQPQNTEVIKNPPAGGSTPTQRIRAVKASQKKPGGETGAIPARTQEIEGASRRPGGGQSGTSQFRTQEIENAASHRPGGASGTGQMRTQEIEDAGAGHLDPRRPPLHRHAKPPPDDSALLAELEQIIKHKLDEPTR